MFAKIALVLGLLIPIALVSQVQTASKGSGNLPHQPTYRIEPVLYQSRSCDPVNDPSSCKPS